MVPVDTRGVHGGASMAIIGQVSHITMVMVKAIIFQILVLVLIMVGGVHMV